MYKRLILFLILAITTISLTFAEENISALVKKVEPSVVLITTYDKDGTASGQGTGFFISASGDIITNRHVLYSAYSAEVKTADGKVYLVDKVLAEDTEGDLIQISLSLGKDTATALSISTSIPEVGEKIVVIGNPLGLEKTVSDGIISAVRDIPAFGKIIQITAPVSPGSSGSPVINLKGEVIGISTFQYIRGQNLNFAIPAERIAKLKPGKGRIYAKSVFFVGAEDWLVSAEGLNSIGLTYLWIEDYKKALPYFESAAKKKPNYAEAYFYIGFCQVELGRYYEAIENYKTAIQINPDNGAAPYNLGVAYGKLGRYSEAIESYKTAIRIEPEDVDVHFGLGFVYANLGRYSEAIECFKTAIRIQPDYADAYYNLGNAYCNLGRYTEAIEAYKQAIHVNPEHAKAHYNLGLAYSNLGRYTEEIEAYKQAIRINPDYAKAYCALGHAYVLLSRFQEAIESFKQSRYGSNPIMHLHTASWGEPIGC